MIIHHDKLLQKGFQKLSLKADVKSCEKLCLVN